MNKLSFKLEFFEGPLDLLLYLIHKNKVNIYDIPISEIADQYWDYLNALDEMDLELASEFLVMAAQLLYIKSSMLLPKHEKENEEEEDPRKELVDRLLEYQKYKQISYYLQERFTNHEDLFCRNKMVLDISKNEPVFIPLSLEDLIKVFHKISSRNERIVIPARGAVERLVNFKRISIIQKAKEILNRLSLVKRLGWLEIFNDSGTRPEIVARFLAVLELLKLNRIILIHEDNDKEMHITMKTDAKKVLW